MKHLSYTLLLLLVASIGLVGCDKKETDSPADEATEESTTEFTNESPATPEPQLSMVELRKSEISATIVDLDPANRGIKLEGENGQIVTMTAGPEVRNYDQLEVGDKVTTTLFESVALDLLTEGEVGEASTMTTTRAKLGDRPGMEVVETYQLRAKVTAVNREEQTVTLEGPDGETQTLEVVGAPNKLKNIKEGDIVVATVSTVLAINVTEQSDVTEQIEE